MHIHRHTRIYEHVRSAVNRRRETHDRALSSSLTGKCAAAGACLALPTLFQAAEILLLDPHLAQHVGGVAQHLHTAHCFQAAEGLPHLAQQVGGAAQQARDVAVVQVAVGGDLRPAAARRPRLHHACAPRAPRSCRERAAPGRSDELARAHAPAQRIPGGACTRTITSSSAVQKDAMAGGDRTRGASVSLTYTLHPTPCTFTPTRTGQAQVHAQRHVHAGVSLQVE